MKRPRPSLNVSRMKLMKKIYLVEVKLILIVLKRLTKSLAQISLLIVDNKLAINLKNHSMLMKLTILTPLSKIKQWFLQTSLNASKSNSKADFKVQMRQS